MRFLHYRELEKFNKKMLVQLLIIFYLHRPATRNSVYLYIRYSIVYNKSLSV